MHETPFVKSEQARHRATDVSNVPWFCRPGFQILLIAQRAEKQRGAHFI